MKERTWLYPFKYEDTKSWNPFVGCGFDCTYCYLQDVLPWQGRTQHCELCKANIPHEHPERLNRIKNAKVLFVSSLGELAFCKHEYMLKIIEAIKRKNSKERIWILQSKAPRMFQKYLNLLPSNVLLDTTLETNRNIPNITKAPMPKTRYEDFLKLEWENKGVTVEPIIDFDLEPFADMLIKINPKVVYLGFNSTPKKTPIPEPSWKKTLKLMAMLDHVDITVLPKLIPKTAYKDFWN